MSETQDVTLESLAWSNNAFLMFFSQEAATPPAQNIHQPKPVRTAHESQHLQRHLSPHALSPAAAAAITQQKPTMVLFLTLVSIHTPKHFAASQASQGLCSETKNLSTCENRPAGGSFPRGSFSRACQPGALFPFAQCLSLHTPHYAWLLTGQDESKDSLEGTFPHQP